MSIFRVFISSTFKDFENERKVLQHIVFPKLKEKCREHGAEFLGVDLRWGISPERSSNSKTIQTCFDEIARCQKLSPKPNFLVLLGQRYGYIPIPEVVPDTLYKLVDEFLENRNATNELWIWRNWYRQDHNDLDGKWLINSRDACRVIPDGSDDYDSLKQSLNNALQLAANSKELRLSESDQCLLSASATEQEIQKGIFDQIPKCRDHVSVWRRTITDLPSSVNDADIFRESSKDAENRLEYLASNLKKLLGSRYIERNTTLAEVHLQESNDQQCKYKSLSTYLRNFADTIFEELWSKIETQIQEEDIEDETSVHHKFAEERSKGIVGRESELNEIKKYLNSEPTAPYFIKAPGGMGKTSLLAKLFSETHTQYEDRKWIARFVGASSNIGSATSLLLSIWPDLQIKALTKKCAIDEKSSREFLESRLLYWEYTESGENWPQNLKDSIKNPDVYLRQQALIEAATNRRNWLISQMTSGFEKPREDILEEYIRIIQNVMDGPLVLVIDALDQVEGYPDLNYLFDRLSDRTYKRPLDDLWIILTSRDSNGLGLKGLDNDAWKACIDKHLEFSNRKLTNDQMAWICKRDHSAGNPLVLKLSSEYAVRLTSWDKPHGDIDLSSRIRSLYEHIGAASEHGLLGEKVLHYLALSRQGIPEDILLKALAIDKDIIEWFILAYPPERYEWSLENGLPPILWSRIQMDLEPYLIRKDVFGSNTLNFFHREFKQEALEYGKLEKSFNSRELCWVLAAVAWKQLTGKELYLNCLVLPPDLFKRQTDGWAVRESPWLLEEAGYPELSQKILCDPSFVITKIRYQGGVESLFADYKRNSDNSWSHLVTRDYQHLMLSANPDEVWIQTARELSEDSLVRISVEKWLVLVNSDKHHLRDLLTQAKAEEQISVGKSAFKLIALDDHRIIIWPADGYLKIIDPYNPLAPIIYLKHVSKHRGKPASWRKIIQLKDSNYLVTYSDDDSSIKGPELVVWDLQDEPQKIAELYADEKVSNIVSESSNSFLVVYKNGKIGRWNLTQIKKIAVDNCLPLELLNQDSEYFTTLADQDLELSFPFEDRRTLIKTDSDNLFVFACKGLTARIIKIKDETVQEFYSQSVFDTNPPRLIPVSSIDDGCILNKVDRSNPLLNSSLFRITSESETKVEIPPEVGTIIEGIWADQHGGFVLLLSQDFPSSEEPWKLVHYNQLLEATWSDDGLPHDSPFKVGEYLTYRKNAGIQIRNLSTGREKFLDLNVKLNEIKLIDAANLLLICDQEFYRVNLETWKVDRFVTGADNLDVINHRDHFLALQPEGILQTWKAGSEKQVIHGDFVCELENGNVLVCSQELFLVFENSGSNLYRQVWEHSEGETSDEVRAVCIAVNGRLLTFGKDFIRIWNTNPEHWLIECQYQSVELQHIDCKRAMSIGNGNYLIEYGSDPVCGGLVAIFRFENSQWVFNPLPLGDAWTDKQYFKLLTQVTPHGDVLFLSTPDDPNENIGFTLYNTNTQQMVPFLAQSPELMKWIQNNESFLDTSRQELFKLLDRWVQDIEVGDKPLEDFYSYLFRKSIKDGILDGDPTYLDINSVISFNAYLGTCSLSNIRVTSTDSGIASYFAPGKFRLWVNQLNTTGRLYLTDANDNLKILQLSKSISNTKVAQS